MSSQEVGPEWILSSFTSPSPGTQDHINELVAVARRLWPRIQAHAVKEQPQKSPDEANHNCVGRLGVHAPIS
jgi:hypothetical protein